MSQHDGPDQAFHGADVDEHGSKPVLGHALAAAGVCIATAAAIALVAILG